MPKIKDLTGQRFGMLTVKKRADDYVMKDGKRRLTWTCVCDCGVEKDIRGTHLTSGAIVSCGCLGHKHLLDSISSHGLRHHRLYGVWCNMKNRCYNEKVKCYPRYGGRGIRVCDEWLHDFKAFYDWAIETGYDETAPYMQCTLDRIDVNGNYEPSNCRWVDVFTQANNKSNNTFLEFNGKRKTISEWGKEIGINGSTISKRLRDGWSIEEALTKKIQKNQYC